MVGKIKNSAHKIICGYCSSHIHGSHFRVWPFFEKTFFPELLINKHTTSITKHVRLGVKIKPLIIPFTLYTPLVWINETIGQLGGTFL